MFSSCSSSSPSIRLTATSVCLKAAQGRTALQETCVPTRRHTGASTHLCAINRAVERLSSLHTASRFMFVFIPRRSHLSVMCKAVRRPSTHYTGQIFFLIHKGSGWCVTQVKSHALYFFQFFTSHIQTNKTLNTFILIHTKCQVYFYEDAPGISLLIGLASGEHSRTLKTFGPLKVVCFTQPSHS